MLGRGRLLFPGVFLVAGALLVAACGTSPSVSLTDPVVEVDRPVAVSQSPTASTVIERQSTARLQTLSAPLDVAVPAAASAPVEETEPGLSGWRATATVDRRYLDAVLADWARHLEGQGYRVRLTSDGLDGALPTTSRSDTATSGASLQSPSTANSNTETATAAGSPQQEPPEYSWLQVRVLSIEGQEHTEKPDTVYLVVSYVTRA